MVRNFIVVFAGLVSFAMAGIAVAQVATRLPWTAGFDGGDFEEWDGFRNTTGVEVRASGCQTGMCARAPLQQGITNDNYGDFHFGDHLSVRGDKIEEVWLRFYSRFDAGIQWPNRSQKLAILNLTDGQSATKHYQVYVYVRPNGDYATDHSYFSAWQFFGLFQNVGAPVQPRLDQWDKIKLHVRLNRPGESDGVVRLWINDELKVDRHDVDIRQNTSYGINKLNLSSYSTQAGVSAGNQWWDSFVLSQTDPDLGIAPMPPSDFHVSRD
jgi:hypothetical protein